MRKRSSRFKGNFMKSFLQGNISLGLMTVCEGWNGCEKDIRQGMRGEREKMWAGEYGEVEIHG